MDAPLYPPAAAFDPPVFASYRLKLDEVSLAELLQVPAAFEIVVKHMPGIKLALSSPQLQAQLGIMTLPSLAVFTGGSPEVLADIDRELAALPPVEGPK